ncbi:MAG: RNA polymerase factor sigma-54 [Fimbriimonadaceae bacterium]
MRIGTGQSVRTEVRVGLRVDPKLVLRSHILQLTQPELEQAVESELNDNPALERLEDDAEPLTEEMVLRNVAPTELKPASEDPEFRRSMPNDDQGTFEWLDLAPGAPSLADSLRAQLFPMLEPELRPVGEFLIGCLDEKGYLGVAVDEIALSTGQPESVVRQVLAKLQQCEPRGIGSTSVRECLLIQLRDAATLEERLAREIVKHFIEDLVARRTSRITRRYKVMPEVVHEAFRLITTLSPFPAQNFGEGPGIGSRPRPAAVVPDLVLRRSEFGWEVLVQGIDPASLAISRAYRERYQKLQADPKLNRDERIHVEEYVNRAANFIESLRERRQTLRRIGEYLVRHQETFVATGNYQYLQPLTRSQVAKDLGLHESSVSRATMGKFVQIGNGEVVAFDVFFKAALRVQKMIEEILSTENPASPLSDEQIARILAQRGVVVARRTVNKYRDRTKLLSSRSRRTA